MIAGSFFSITLFAATLSVEIRQPVDEDKAAELVEWVQSTADTIGLVYGRFPNPNAKIIVMMKSRNWLISVITSTPSGATAVKKLNISGNTIKNANAMPR